MPSIQVDESTSGELIPYSFASTTAQLDTALLRLNGTIKQLISLAEIEKASSMLADQIEKNKRRVKKKDFLGGLWKLWI